jgi:phage gp46-like protein
MIQDILIYESGDNGDLYLESSDIATVSSFSNCFYLALFGGNLEQNTTPDIADGEIREDWWGNAIVENQFNSNFERALNNTAINTAGIKALEDAALEDLQFLTDLGDISVDVSILAENKISLEIYLKTANNSNKKVKFVFDNFKNELIEEIQL